MSYDSNPRNSWNTSRRTIDLGHRPCIMGILNVTPDSFSDGTKFLNPQKAVDHALMMQQEGADIIDIGGESTRPGADAVSADDELRRVMPVLEALSGKLEVPISIDTYKAAVAREAVACGAEIINDISGLTFDPEMRKVAAATRVGVVLMHTRGRPAEMQKKTVYRSVIGEISRFLKQAVEAAEAAGIDRSKMVIDPGIGFGKDADGNFEILRKLRKFMQIGLPILVGASRKAFLGSVIGKQPEERIFGTAAATAIAIANGASILRVHDVKEMREVADVTHLIIRGA